MMRNWTVAATIIALAAALVWYAQRTGASPAASAATQPPLALAAGAPQATGPAAPRPAPALTGAAASCKPTVPLALELQALGAGRWRLQYGSPDQDRDVTVWMWSGNESARREVWRGRLQQGVSRQLEVGYTPTDAASPVWAAVEARSPLGDGMRRLASVSPRGTTLPGVAAPAAQLLEDPATGERILQFTGQTEAGR